MVTEDVLFDTSLQEQEVFHASETVSDPETQKVLRDLAHRDFS